MEILNTIAAIATPIGQAGLGVIRVSGPLAPEIGQALFRPAHAGCAWLSHRAYFGDIVSADGTTVLDEGLVTLMRKPHSFTGEDVLEISCHGNPLILNMILEQLLARGCRLARPGEFSERAFLNGRMDLAQAEALAFMIAAKSEKAYLLSLAQLKGALGDEIGDLRLALIDALANLEAAIDFSDEIAPDEAKELPPQIEETIVKMGLLLSSYEQTRLINKGFAVVITGKPNAGKSSLLNKLLGRKKAIVTDIPGTTRDAITETISCNGFTISLTDTAGIRQPHDIIEKQGMEIAGEHLENADLIILMMDGSQPLDANDILLLNEQQSRQRRTLVAINKSDLPAVWNKKEISEACQKDWPVFNISAKSGEGLEQIRQALSDLTMGKETSQGGAVLIQLRHKQALEKSRACLTTAKVSLQSGDSPELAAFELREAIDYLDEITGKKITDEVLDKIFSSFCIGK